MGIFQVRLKVRHSGNQFTYDQFINCSLDELERLARTSQTPIPYSSKDKKSYMA
jgi:hypothetical protein